MIDEIELEARIKEAKDMRLKYYDTHSCCPKCGYSGSRQTLMGYVMDMSKPEEFKDLNRSTCTKCGDVHTVHDRVPCKGE